jgi:hypothetical protein
MNDWFAELRDQVRRAMAADGGEVTRLVRAALEGGDQRQTPLERALVAVAGVSAAAVGVGLAVTSMVGLALAAVILYVVLTRVFGFDLKLDPATMFGGMWPGHVNKEPQKGEG